MSRFAAVVSVLGMLIGSAAIATIAATPALALQTPQDLVVSDNPAGFTPHVLDGEVLAIAVVGDKVILGGEFTKAQNASGGPVLTRVNILAFNKNTGAIDTSFVPNFDRKIRTLAPGPDGHSVYVGGQFNHVNGQTAYKITRIDTNTGARVASFNAGLVNALVYDVKYVAGRLFIAGQFTQIKGQDRSLIAELDPNTGALKPGAVTFGGTHHGGFTMVYKFDTNPDATRLTAIGNFMTVNGLPRVQVASFDISGQLTLDTNWRTTQYEPMCYDSFEYYVRDIDYSPDGSYYVISSTGGYGSGPPTLCDTITRWATDDSGQSVMPTWVAYAGGDSTYAVAVTGTAIYGGGHTRWFNNPFRGDAAGQGAVPREGIEALDPANGVPLSWDPGRTRGRGVFDMVATDTGMWVGSDTDRIGNYEYHGRIAFFPLAGGTPVPRPSAPSLPADVYLAGQSAGPSQHIPYRVDPGGAALATQDNGPDWAVDTDGEPSPYRNSGSNAAGWSAVPNVDATVPPGTPRAIFDSERWDPGGGNEMNWDFPLAAGTHATVRLYFANRCTCTETIGSRVFDVRIDGTTVLDNYDIVADVGHDVGTMKSYSIVSDGNIDIDFGHVVENPLINGIEIINDDVPDDPPASQLKRRTYDGSTAGATTAAPAGTINWPTVRGGFWLDGTLYLATTSGFVKRTFDGTSYGSPTTLDLYGLTNFQTDMSSMTSLFYDGASIYFTLAGDNNLYRRYFTVESGIVGAQRFTMPSGGVSWSQARGAFLANGSVYWATASGDLHRVTWSDNGPVSGTDTVVSGPGIDGNNWAAKAMFTLPGTVPNQSPTADIDSACTGLTCAFDGTGSSDPDGTIASYAWTFGDGGTGTRAEPAHTYAAAGTYTVGLVVTDDDGATGSTSAQVTVEEVATPVTYVGSSEGTVLGSSAAPSVTLPGGIQAGDALVVAMSMNAGSATVSDPAGWTRVADDGTNKITTIVWKRTATADDAGKQVTVSVSTPVKSSLVAAAYRNATVVTGGTLLDVETANRADHTTPATTAAAGSWVVSIWTDKTADTTSWVAPAGQRVLQTGYGNGSGRVSWLMTDSNGPVGGAVGGLTATADSSSKQATMVTVVLSPTA